MPSKPGLERSLVHERYGLGEVRCEHGGLEACCAVHGLRCVRSVVRRPEVAVCQWGAVPNRCCVVPVRCWGAAVKVPYGTGAKWHVCSAVWRPKAMGDTAAAMVLRA